MTLDCRGLESRPDARNVARGPGVPAQGADSVMREYGQEIVYLDVKELPVMQSPGVGAYLPFYKVPELLVSPVPMRQAGDPATGLFG
jgi:hypothetical protein